MSIGITNATINLYSDVPIEEDKNMIVDNMAAFLTGRVVLLTASIGYFSPSLDSSIRLALPDNLAASKAKLYAQVVCEYANEAGATLTAGTYYYFVREITRNANKTCSLTLHMDVLNSYSSKIKAGFNAKTMIAREHEDRFKQPATLPSSWPRVYNLAAIFDRVGEGFTPRKYLFSETNIQQDNAPSANFYLMYKTANALSVDNLSNPVSCSLVADDAIFKQGSFSGQTLTKYYEDFEDGKYYAILNEDHAFKLTTEFVNSATGQVESTFTFDSAAGYLMIVFYKYSDGTNHGFKLMLVTSDYARVVERLGTATNYFRLVFTEVESYRASSVLSSQVSYYLTQPRTFVNSGAGFSVSSIAFEGVSRTDSRYMKIIKLPYSPVAFSKDSNNGYNFAGFDFDFTDRVYTLASINSSFQSKVTDIDVSSIVVYQVTNSSLNSALVRPRFIFDPKCYHSDFYTYKFNYDTFSVAIDIETLDYTFSAIASPSIEVDFKPTNTINSNFAFRFTPKNGLTWQFTEDYQNVLLSSRNNEMTIFSNSYIDYIRTGYNYDKKSKTIAATTSWIGTIASIGGGIAGAVLGKDPVTKATGVGLAISGFAQLAGAIGSTIQNENTMAEKLAQLKAQSTGTAGTDDIDLLSFYGENKLRKSIYYVSNEMSGLIQDLFYYYGYARNYQAAPNFASRTWFNFVQCTPVWLTTFLTASMKECVDEISAKFQAGVTDYHANEVHGVLQWDLDQQHENFESWFFN